MSNPVTRFEIFTQRFAVIFASLIFFTVGVVEIITLIGIKLAWVSIREAMWIGAGFWGVIALISWVELVRKTEDDPIWTSIVFTLIFAGSASGIYFPFFTGFSLWSNAILGCFCCLGIVFAFPQLWAENASIHQEG